MTEQNEQAPLPDLDSNIIRRPKIDNVFESVLTLPGEKKKIVTIGTRHGSLAEPFIGKKQTERDLRTVFGTNIDALSLDSLSVSTVERSAKGISKLNPERDNFWNWGVRFASENGIPLIISDPIQSVRGVYQAIPFADARGQREADRQYTAYQNKSDRRLRQLEVNRLIAKGVTGLTSVVLGLTILSNLGQGLFSEKVNRRDFFRRSRSAATALGLTLFGANEAMGSTAAQILDILVQFPDDKWVNALVNESRELDEADYNDPKFKMLSEYFTKANQTLALWRNAVNAEVLTATPKVLLNDSDGNGLSNIANIWGHNHLEVNEQYRIGQLLQNPTQRRTVIEAGLKALLVTCTPEEKQLIKNDLVVFPAICKIDSESNVTTTKFPVPAIENIVSSIK